jgi:hypothetical protein
MLILLNKSLFKAMAQRLRKQLTLKDAAEQVCYAIRRDDEALANRVAEHANIHFDETDVADRRRVEEHLSQALIGQHAPVLHASLKEKAFRTVNAVDIQTWKTYLDSKFKSASESKFYASALFEKVKSHAHGVNSAMTWDDITSESSLSDVARLVLNDIEKHIDSAVVTYDGFDAPAIDRHGLKTYKTSMTLRFGDTVYTIYRIFENCQYEGVSDVEWSIARNGDDLYDCVDGSPRKDNTFLVDEVNDLFSIVDFSILEGEPDLVDTNSDKNRALPEHMMHFLTH